MTNDELLKMLVKDQCTLIVAYSTLQRKNVHSFYFKQVLKLHGFLIEEEKADEIRLINDTLIKFVIRDEDGKVPISATLGYDNVIEFDGEQR